MGEGPCQDAFQSGLAVHTPRIDAAAFERWPSFSGMAKASGVAAFFAYPLITHGTRVGVLTLYQDAKAISPRRRTSTASPSRRY